MSSSQILRRTLVGVSLSCTLVACSHSGSNTQNAAAQTASNNSGPPIHGNVCDNGLLKAEDFVGILDEPVTGTKPLKGDTQTCYFITATNGQGGAEVMVSLRGGLGRATIASFTSGHMNEYSQWKPLSGVGEEAVWVPMLHEVQAQQANVLCDVQTMQPSKALRDAGEGAQQQKLGGLCNKVFAALKLPSSGAQQSIRSMAGGNIVEPACEKDIGPADVADLITAPVVKRPGLAPESCSYHAQAGATVSISLSRGDEGKNLWSMMSNPANVGTTTPLAGVGDVALHSHSGTAVLARRGDLVCSVDITGTDNADGMKVVTNARGEELARKLGALCAKVFAARG